MYQVFHHGLIKKNETAASTIAVVIIVGFVKGAKRNVPSKKTAYPTNKRPISLEKRYPLSKNCEKRRNVTGKKRMPPKTSTDHQTNTS